MGLQSWTDRLTSLLFLFPFILRNPFILGLIKYIHFLLNTSYFLPFFFFTVLHSLLRILVPQPGNEPRPSAVKVPSPNHWTARGNFPILFLTYTSSSSGNCFQYMVPTRSFYPIFFTQLMISFLIYRDTTLT